MKITKQLTDTVILEEFGDRLARARIDQQLTQAALANQAGVSKRTVERIEAGASAQMSSCIRIFRVLELLRGLDLMIPEAAPRPMELLKLKGKVRQRASKSRNEPKDGAAWSWDDDT
jgi:transcriptional regulator with XRE-family HTH domain